MEAVVEVEVVCCFCATRGEVDEHSFCVSRWHPGSFFVQVSREAIRHANFFTHSFDAIARASSASFARYCPARGTAFAADWPHEALIVGFFPSFFSLSCGVQIRTNSFDKPRAHREKTLGIRTV